MKTAITAIFVVLVLVAPASAESVTNALTHQGGGDKACDTTGNLPSGKWSQVSSDNAGQPCVEKNNEGDVDGTGLLGDSDDTCNTNTIWDYNAQGHVTFGPPTSGTRATLVAIRVYIGGGGGVCTGGNTVQCASGYKLVDSSSYAVGPYNESVRFEAGVFGLAAYYSTPGDGNFQAFYVFAEPIVGSIKCTANNYATTEHN